MKRKIAIILGTIITLSSTELSLASNIQPNENISQDILQEQEIKANDMKTNINPEEYINLVELII